MLKASLCTLYPDIVLRLTRSWLYDVAHEIRALKPLSSCEGKFPERFLLTDSVTDQHIHY